MTNLSPMLATPTILPVRPQRRLWLITFVDLVMLLLAFFVLMFSMTSVDKPRFSEIARSYADAFHGAVPVEKAKTAPLHVAPLVRTPGDSLAYLETVLRANFARDAGLSAIQFRLTTQYLILMVPVPMTAGADGGTFDSETQSRFFGLGGVLSNLPNRIAIVAPATAGNNAAAWWDAATRARAVRASLEAAGYPQGVTSFVQGSAPAEDGDEESHVQIVVFPEAASGTEATP